MTDTIYDESNPSGSSGMEYILRPPNTIQVRFNHSEYASEIQPMLAIDVRGVLKMAVCKQQLYNLIIATNKLIEIVLIKDASEFRPESSPTQDKKEWWRYTFRKMTNNYQKSSAEDMAVCIKNRKPYMVLFRKYIASEGNCSQVEEDQLDELEALLPLSALITYQRTVIEQCLEELATSKTGRLDGDSPKKRRSVVSKLKKVFGIKRPKDLIADALAAAAAGNENTAEVDAGLPSSPGEGECSDQGDDIALDQLTNAMDRELDMLEVDVSHEEHIACRLEFNLLVDCDINYAPSDPCLLAHANFSAFVEFKPTNLALSFSAEDLYIRDMSVADSLLPYVVTFSNLTFPKAGARITEIPVSSSRSNISISFSNQKKVGASLRIDALPLRIVVSQPFIRKLADIFITLPPANQYLLKRKCENNITYSLNSEVFDYFKADTFSFAIEADAPKIIAPEDIGRDCGYLVVDAGSLIIRGRIEQNRGLNFEMLLMKLNAGLPSSLESCLSSIAHDVSHRKALPNVLLFPFDTCIIIQNEKTTDANVCVDIDIKPELKIEVTPSSFARLLFILESIVSLGENIALAKLKGTRVQQNALVGLESSVIGSESQVNTLSDIADLVMDVSGKKTSKQKGSILSSKITEKMRIQISIPTVLLIMKFDIHQNFISTTLGDISCTIVCRSWDLQVDAYAASIFVQDSIRPELQRGVVWNQTDDKFMHLDTRLKCQISKVFDKRSPRFHGSGAQIDIQMNNIMFRLDSNTILHLRPFLDSFLAYTMINRSTGTSSREFEEVPMTLQQVHRIEKDMAYQKKKKSPSSTDILQDSKVMIELKQLSIEILRPAGLDDLSISREKRGALLDSVYCLHLEGIKLGLKIQQQLLSVDVNVKNCLCEDTRVMSTDFAYKEMVNTTYDRSVWIAKAERTNLTARDSFFIKSQSAANQAVDFFAVSYVEEAANKSTVKVDIHKTAVFMSVDTILDSLHVSLQNSFAIMKLVQICEEREAYVSEAPIMHTKPIDVYNKKHEGVVRSEVRIPSGEADNDDESSTTNLKPPRPDENQHLEVYLREPLIFLLEDPSIENTRALMCSTHLDIEKTLVTHNSSRRERQEVLDTTVSDIEVFSVSSMQDVTVERIINPFGLTFHCRQELLVPTPSHRQILSADTAVQVENVEINLCVDDLSMIYSAGMRYLIAKEWSASKAPSGSIYDSSLILFGGEPKQVTDGTLIGVYMISVVVNKSKLCVSENSRSLLLVSVNDIAFYADGALQPTCYFDSSSIRFSLVSHHVEGGGSVEVSIDFYNLNLSIWEPLVETFAGIIRVSRGQKGLTFNIISKGTMQVNISGAVVKRLLDIVEYLKHLSQRSRYDVVGTKNYDSRLSLERRDGKKMAKGGLTRRLLKKISKNSIKIFNCLPVSFKYICRNDSGSEEMGELYPGDMTVLDSMDLTKRPKLSFQVGNYSWTRPRRVRTNEKWSDITDLVYAGGSRSGKDREGTYLTLSLTSAPVVTEDAHGFQEGRKFVNIDYTVYSKAIFLDRTQIGLSVKSRYTSSLDAFTKENIRYSFSESIPKVHKERERGGSFSMSSWLASSSNKQSKPAYGRQGDAMPVISKLKVISRRSYTISTAAVGKNVYTDSEYRWTHLKSFLSGHNQYICTANSDCKTVVKELISFTITQKPAFVLVFVDARMKVLPHWIIDEGYSRALFAEPAVAELTSTGKIASVVTNRRYFQAWGKYYNTDELVVMGGNGSGANSTDGMYVAAVVDPFSPRVSQSLSEDMAEQIGFNYDYNEDYWSEGGNSVCLFHTADGSFNVGDSTGQYWSSSLTLDGLNSTKQPFEISNKASKRKYMLSYVCVPLPGIFYRTKLVTVIPRILVVNRMDEKIFLRQYALKSDGSKIGEVGNEMSVDAFSVAPWHQENHSIGTLLQLRTESTQWSFRGFDVNEIGTCDLLLPSTGGERQATVIGHIDVRIASRSDNCSVIVFITSACISEESSMTSISIKNESDENITVYQANVIFEYEKSLSKDDSLSRRSDYVVSIPPNVWTPFGWADPFIDPQLTVVVGKPPHDPSTMISTTIGILKLRDPCRLAYPMKSIDEHGHEKYSINAELELEVFAIGCGRVLRIYRVANQYKDDSRSMIGNMGNATTDGRSSPTMLSSPALSQTATGATVIGAVLGTLILGPIGGLAVGGGLVGAFTAASIAQPDAEEEYDVILPASGRIKSTVSTLPFISEDIFVSFGIEKLGVSLIVERPQRRELLSLHLMQMQGQVKSSNSLMSVEFAIQDFQLDNFSESALYPVLMHSVQRKSSETLNDGDSSILPAPAVHLIIVRDESFPSRTRTPHFRYIALRILEIELAIDSATIQILLSDLTEDLGVVTPDQKLCLGDPQRWMHNYSRLLLSPGHRLHFYSRAMSQISTNMYIEQLILHPISLNVTYSHTEFPRTEEDNVLAMLSYIPSFAAVDRFPIQMSSFTVDQVLESTDSLVARILKKSLYDLQSHLANLAGSLAILGRPVGLVKNIGGGVQALFYEPWEGLMKSPHSFFIGIGKGTGQFVSGLVVGTLESSASLVGSYSAGISSGLSYMSMDKKLIKQRNKIRREGIEAARKGILHSFINAGKNVMGGISSGVTGLVTRPLEEAEKDGAIGFMRGVGIGVLGVAVKPVLGVTDGISSTMQGISYNVGDYRTPEILRGPRVLQNLTVTKPGRGYAGKTFMIGGTKDFDSKSSDPVLVISPITSLSENDSADNHSFRDVIEGQISLNLTEQPP